MPNERWQADITHWRPRRIGTEVEIMNVNRRSLLRFLVASDARGVFKAADVVASFRGAAGAHGLPAQMLTDNGAVFTAVPRKGRCAYRGRDRRARTRYGALEPLPPADLREGGAVPPDAQEVAGPPRPGSQRWRELQDQLDRFAATTTP